jgi:RNA polymerase sigma factor (sigma-70 family)
LDLNNYISVNYKKLYTAAKNVTKGHELTDDLFQHCIEVLITDKDQDKMQRMVETNQLHYYFTAILIRNYNSSTSRFHYIYRKGSDLIAPNDVYNVEVLDEGFDYDREAKIDFIEDCIKDLTWYEKKMIELHFQEGLSYQKISDLTGIPKTSCFNTIKNIEKLIRNKYNGGN